MAEPAAITKAKTEAEALQERVDELGQQLDAAVEDYDYAKAKLAETKIAAQKTQAQLTKAEKDYATASGHLSDRIVEIYKQGQLGALDALVGCASFSELINRLGLMERLSQQDAKLVDEVTAYQDEATKRKAELTQQLGEETTLAADAKAAKAKIQDQLAVNEKALAGKEKLLAQLQKEEAIRQAKLAAEARRRAELARKQAILEKARKKAGLGGSSNVNVYVPASASASDVVSIAMKYLGCPYVWGGSSPNGFDCSGFVLYVYKKVGITLPHSSRMQYTCGISVPRNSLKPGDLVFFFFPISHVGLYIGSGQMVNAAGVGKGVCIDDIWTNSFNCACRIIL